MGKYSSMFDQKKKKGPSLSDNEKSAKISVMKDLQHRASSAMSENLKGLKQGTPGFNQAGQEFKGTKNPTNVNTPPGTPDPSFSGDSEDDDSSEHAGMSLEECTAEIAKLTAMKEKLEQDSD